MSEQKKFSPGRNIAMKVPPHAHEDTVRFYRDVLGFEELAEFRPAVVFKFGDKNLWIDRVPGLSQAEIWLEVQTNDLAAAEQRLAGGSDRSPGARTTVAAARIASIIRIVRGSR
jgi:catechol 2,3-dioxygenase-like lactoylglutathione lyase family enzyme